ncbi:MAG: hypothetical protein LKI58_11990 [Actinomyces sp.]|jgi:hypothetical protein|nr:hypothetical protein [Actinomyces sp.]MCI1788753.1 hypothetical protein [Actinomyces sp.]MCI1831146.1 hypothetical protein [Actinomyces sp.]
MFIGKWKLSLTESQRRRIYNISSALLALIAIYGGVSTDARDSWILFVAAILGILPAQIGKSNLSDNGSTPNTMVAEKRQIREDDPGPEER